MSSSSLHAKRCTPKRPAALRVVKRHSTTRSLTCTRAWGQIQNPKRKLKIMPKAPHNNPQDLPRQLRVIQHMSIRPLGTLRTRSTGSSACSRRPKTPPRIILSLSWYARFGAKRRKEEKNGNSGFYSRFSRIRAHVSGARIGFPIGYSNLPDGPRTSAAPARRHVIRVRPTRRQHVSVDPCTPTTDQRQPIGGRHVDRTRAPRVSGLLRQPSRHD